MFRILALLVLAALVAPGAAFAQTAPAVQTIDLSFWLQLLLSVSAIVIPAILALIAAWAKSHFKLAASGNAASLIDLAVTAGQQYVSAALAKAPASATIAVKNQAIAEFLELASASTKAAIASEGLTPAIIAQRIDGAVSSALGLSNAVIPATTPAAPAAPAAT